MDLSRFHVEIDNQVHRAIERVQTQLQSQVRMAVDLQVFNIGDEVSRMIHETSRASSLSLDSLRVNAGEILHAAKFALEGRASLKDINDDVRSSLFSQLAVGYAFSPAGEIVRSLDMALGRSASVLLGELALPFPWTGDLAFDSEQIGYEELEDEGQNQAIILPETKLLVPSNAESFAVVPIYISASKLLSIFKSPEAMRDLSPREFEEFCADLLVGHGWEDVVLTPASKDGGKDIEAALTVKGFRHRYYFECKKYAPANRIGEEILNALLGVISRKCGIITAGAVMTTSEFTKPARNMFESDNRLAGFDYAKLIQMTKEWRDLNGAQAG